MEDFHWWKASYLKDETYSQPMIRPSKNEGVDNVQDRLFEAALYQIYGYHL